MLALLIVLTVQLFWPFQHLLHVLGFGGRDYAFKLALGACHALWFTFNLAQFITTTLRFVEPNARETWRERYCANEIIPRDAKKRVMRTLFYSAPQQIFGKEMLDEGPYIAFGHHMGLGGIPTTEVVTVFSGARRLVDVWFGPLRWALRRWRQRVRKQPRKEKR